MTELWPDDGALHIPSLDALAIADTVLNETIGSSSCPTSASATAMAERRSIREGLARLADELEFGTCCSRTARPWSATGRERLREFTDAV